MTLTLKAAAVTTAAAAAFSLFKSKKSEYAVVLAAALSAALLLAGAVSLSPYIAIIGSVFSAVDSDVLSVSLKAVGIGCITSLAAGIAADSGMSSASETVRFLGKAALFMLAFPLFKKLLDTGLAFL